MKSKITKLYLLMIMSMMSFIANAQVAPPDGGDDPLPTPINNYLIVLAVIGIYFAYSFLNKRLSIKSK